MTVKIAERGFKNFYYSVRTAAGAQTPKPLDGAIKLSFKPQSKSTEHTLRGESQSVSEYTEETIETKKNASLDIISLPDSFLVDVLGYYIDENGVMMEGEQKPVHFALLYETTYGNDLIRYEQIDCLCTKPSFDVSTISETPSIDTRSLELIINKDIKSGFYSKQIRKSTNPEIFEKWFDKVY